MGPLPFGFGFHPAFVCPLPGATTASPFRSGRLELSPGLFAKAALVFPAAAGPGLRYGVPGGPRLRFAFEGLPDLALWTKPGAPFLCVQPWQGMAAHEGASPGITARPGTLTLAPSETRRFAMGVTPD